NRVQAASTVHLLIAIPANVLADEPPVTWSAASEKLPLNSEFTVAPAGDAVSSLIAASVALPDATGASFTAVTVTSITSVALENVVVPPLLDVSTLVPALPLLWSQPRIVSADVAVPFQLAAGA